MSDVFEPWRPLSRTMRVLVLVHSLALAGCASVPAPDATVAYECERDMRATQTPWFSRGLLDVIQDQQFYNQCVRARTGAAQP
jgi:hypothetical protein